MSKKKLIIINTLILSACILAVTYLIYYYWIINLKQINPLSPQASSPVQIIPKQPSHYQIIGFLPYWQLSNTEYIQHNLLTQLAYFGIAIDDQGQITKQLPDRSKELGLQRLTSDNLVNSISTNRQSGSNPILVIRAMSTDSIQAAVDPQNSIDIQSQIVNLAKEHGYTGLNIDFEPTSQTTPLLMQQVTSFTENLNRLCKQTIPNCILSIDIYASASTNPRIWDLPRLEPHVDYFILMGYDFFRTSSASAGPNAPIHGSPNRWKYDLQSSLNSLFNILPNKKIILGVPWYGYEWTTINSTPGSTAIAGTGRVATYTRTQQLLSDCRNQILANCQTGIDSDALSPFLIYNTNQLTWQQVWFDDENSLELKYQLVQDRNLGGIAIWALGYEAPTLEFWQQISRVFFSS